MTGFHKGNSAGHVAILFGSSFVSYFCCVIVESRNNNNLAIRSFCLSPPIPGLCGDDGDKGEGNDKEDDDEDEDEARE
jgi:hypothetical protein